MSTLQLVKFMNDRELLELAAKAADITLLRWGKTAGAFVGEGYAWSPLTDDGDALRLAVTLHLSLTLNSWGAGVGGVDDRHRQVFEREKQGEGGLPAATRRAIVRAAAAIGAAKC